MQKRKIFYAFVTLLVLISCNTKSQSATNDASKDKTVSLTDSTKIYTDSLMAQLRVKAKEAKAYSAKNKLSTKYSILVDLNIHSGRERLFLWDYEKDTVKLASVCCHGKGGKSTHDTPEFSNKEGSNCSSLGHYRVGKRAPSSYGIKIHYKLHGLDATNSNAFKRYVVLHSYDSIPHQPPYPEHIRLSSGCPAIADNKMVEVDAFLQKQQTPLLLWIYY